MGDDDEKVYSFAFGETLDRLYNVLILLSDVVKEFGGEIGDWLKKLWHEIDLSWIDDADNQARRRKDEDLSLHGAA